MILKMIFLIASDFVRLDGGDVSGKHQEGGGSVGCGGQNRQMKSDSLIGCPPPPNIRTLIAPSPPGGTFTPWASALLTCDCVRASLGEIHVWISGDGAKRKKKRRLPGIYIWEFPR